MYAIRSYYAFGDIDLLFGGEQRHFADFLEIHADGVVNTHAVGDAKVELYRFQQLVGGNGFSPLRKRPASGPNSVAGPWRWTRWCSGSPGTGPAVPYPSA